MIASVKPADPANAVRLVVNGQEYGGWKSVRIEAGIERQARSFDLEVTDRWPGQTDIPRRIQPGDPCQVFIGQDLVMTGYVDGTPIRYDGKSVGVGVKGRSKTADLVDCCPIESGKSTASGDGGTWKDVIGPDGKKPNVVKAPATAANQWRNQKMEVIAAAMAAPYGVRVIAEVDTGKVIPEHHVQVGETVFESIDRMMRLRHVLSTDNEKGDLVFIDVGSAGRAGTALELGKNIMSGSTELDYKGVFSEYIVKGQRAGNDEQYGADVSEEEGEADDYSPATVTGETATATDARAKRRRVLVIKQSGQADDGTCKDRAEYERAHRAAKALQTSYTVAGWRQEDGALWLPNMMVRVRDGLIGFDTDMVIAEAAWILDKEGFRTEIKVGPPDGYRTKAGKLKASKSQKGGGPEWSDVK
jgi:prophage tail gpP-like protein